ncbi:MAG: hypothetical protein LBB68_04140 [Treponema sp.]|jgi:hypothetical protein|nr:hypothetical protein [Treponema sp.]
MDEITEEYQETIKYLRELQEFDPVKASYLQKKLERIPDFVLHIKATVDRMQNVVKDTTSCIENRFTISD